MTLNPTQELTCIRCPVGCLLKVTLRDDRVTEVDGHQCERGQDYAQIESINPVRALSTTLPVVGGEFTRLPVRTASDVPKNQIAACMAALRDMSVNAPVVIGQVIVPNIAGTGVGLIATRTVSAAPRVPAPEPYHESGRVHRR